MKRSLLKLTIRPSLQNGLIITLFEDRSYNEREYFLRCEESRIEDIKITEEDADKLLLSLEQASIRSVPECLIGLDDTLYDLVATSGSNEGHYRWCGRTPKGWEVLGDVANILLRLAGKIVAPKTVWIDFMKSFVQ